jgi:multisubunit Na+/H+ antiporter MnhB subunit
MIKKFLTCLGLAPLAGATSWVVWQLPDEPGGLTELVNQNIGASGVSHPVTAVLLNFRAYDTWLELGVLLTAMFGILCLQRREHLASVPSTLPKDAVLEWLLRWLMPLMVLVAGYLLWLGKFDSGGAFQAGVILGAAAVLWWLAGHRLGPVLEGQLWRGILVLGLAVFHVAAAGLWLSGREMLEYPPLWAGTLILVIETAAALSIGLVLGSLFIGLQDSSPVPQDQHDSPG